MVITINKTTRTKQVEKYLRDQIATGKWNAGDILPGSDKLADLLNISKITLSNAMEPLVREGLLIRKTGVGTLVTDLVDSANQNIVIFTSVNYDSIQKSSKLASGDFSYFEIALVKNIYKSFADTVPLLISHCNPNKKKILDLYEGRISGGIELMEFRKPYSTDTTPDFPTVTLSPYVSEAKNEVVLDLVACYKNAFDILKANGIERTLFVNYDYGLSAELVDKWQSVRDRLMANSVEDMLHNCPGFVNLPISYEEITSGASYYKARNYIENNDLPEAIFIADDTFIPGIYHMLQDLNLNVPGDIKVFCITNKGRNYGYNLDWSRLEYDPKAIAELLVKILKDCKNDNYKSIKQYAWPEYIKGSSM